LDGVVFAAGEPGPGVRNLKVRRTVNLVESRIEGLRFDVQCSKRNMARDRSKRRPNQSLEPIARASRLVLAHEPRHSRCWLTI